MSKASVINLIDDLQKLETDAIEFFRTTTFGPADRSLRDGKEVVVFRWFPTAAQSGVSRDLKRRYDAWYFAALNMVREFTPYSAPDLESDYDTVMSYLLYGRYLATSPESINTPEARAQFDRMYLESYIDEWTRLLDNQTRLLQTIQYFPEQATIPPFRCFLSGFPCPTPLQQNSMLVFVLMPFAGTFDEIYQDGIKGAVKAAGLQCKRADEIIHTRNVMCTAVCQSIRAARYVVADITGQNANVFYELGMTHGRAEDQDQGDKHVIIITQRMEDIPFDLRQLNVILYTNKDDLKQRLTSMLLNLQQATSDLDQAK